ncbi:unnamed protein product [Bursaphelenchus xylophilus]|uniref:(pine wood nematode) hypothetical protein n=1 Tax=Bursaphelenchus xylophilus TaxID=6326 RepID=A0A1I7SLI2_BURXY|nr:unnamed protein product [Bursaphelenchus xylophilus]CAG9129614.1 unnamed protein product [Bursaphelenchus xylophilus]
MMSNQRIFYLHKWIGFSFNCISFSTSSMLLYLVLKKSRKMPNIRPILLAGAVIDFTYSLLNLCANHMFIVSDKSLLLLTDPMLPFPQIICDAILVIGGFFVALSWLTVPVQYNYRLYIIKHGSAPPWSLLLIQATMVLIMSSIGTYLIYFVYFVGKDAALVSNVMELMKIDFDENLVFGKKFESPPMQIYFAYFSLMSTLALINIVIADRKIRQNLKAKESIMGKRTKKLHAELSKALFVMAISPVFSSFSQVIYISVALNRTGGSLFPDVVSSMLATSAPLINSVTTMYFVRPYRLFFIRLIRGGFESSSVEVYVNNTHTHPLTITNRPRQSSLFQKDS